jgi:CRP-like cAMP-binding protein/rhodanese-related sulfurtransferase
MSDASLNIDTLRSFTPLDGLKRENLAALAKKTQLQRLAAGKLLFRKGDSKKRTYYLVSGTIELSDREGKSIKILGGSEEARSPIAPMLPRTVSAMARDDVEYISIDSDLLDVMLTWDQTGAYEVKDLKSTENPDSADWMTTLLQSKAFHRIPPGNIQAVFMRMQRIEYSAGDVVIQQGDVGDFFYAITEGKCLVTRETPLNKEGIKLAELGKGSIFGEEALISNALRNATVVMETDGVLMRLGKEDFNTLMNEPMLEWVDYGQAKDVVAAGGRWLDVRLPSEYESYHEDNAINIPLYFIRLKLNTLDKKIKYVLCCDTGARSSAGAFILNEKDFQSCVLQGGLNANKPA